MSDKEQFVCLSCYFVGELDVHGRCVKCLSEKVMSKIVLEALGDINAQAKTPTPPEREYKKLRWWHFVCGPFETYISNYRVTNLEEAKHEVTHDNFSWTVWQNPFVDPTYDDILVEELSAAEYEVQWRQGNARKSEYYQTPSVDVEAQIEVDNNETQTPST